MFGTTGAETNPVDLDGVWGQVWAKNTQQSTPLAPPGRLQTPPQKSPKSPLKKPRPSRAVRKTATARKPHLANLMEALVGYPLEAIKH